MQILSQLAIVNRGCSYVRVVDYFSLSTFYMLDIAVLEENIWCRDGFICIYVANRDQDSSVQKL